MELEEGTEVSWSVSKTGYTTQSGTYTMTNDDEEKDITLVIKQFTFTIAASPDDATVVINDEARTSLTADYGTAIAWSVSKEGYETQTGTYTLTEDKTETVSLEQVQL